MELDDEEKSLDQYGIMHNDSLTLEIIDQADSIQEIHTETGFSGTNLLQAADDQIFDHDFIQVLDTDWTCQQCTFLNRNISTSCEICNHSNA